MINLTKGVPSRFHHIRLNFKDLKMWKTFLADWNGRCLFSKHYRYALPANGAIY